MYKVVVYKQIHSCFARWSSSDVYLEKRLELPFAPFTDCEIASGEWNEVLKAIAFDVDKNEFHCYTEEDKEWYNKGLKEGLQTHATEAQMAEKVKEYQESGWELKHEEERNERT